MSINLLNIPGTEEKTFGAINSIVAENLTSDDNTVEPSGNITFTAGQGITLKPNFHAISGGEFLAEIKPLSNGGNGNTEDMYLTEHHIFGSSRLGMEQKNLEITEETTTLDNTVFENKVGDKRYELSNHLGNVLSVITDRKLGSAGDYSPDVVAFNDYYPFGMLLPGRKGSTSDYRYGFQGQELDNEIKGEGNSLNYKYRMHDSRVGRFFAVDPLFRQYPHYTPYSFSGNKVISHRELEGLEEAITTFGFETDGKSKVKYVSADLIVDETKARKEIIRIDLNNIVYEANSYQTLLGRDDRNNEVGDFSNIRNLSDKDLSGFIGYARFVFGVVHSKKTIEEAVLMESNAGPLKTPSNLLDFKNSAYDILGIKRDELIGIDGVVYNANEAGNYIWGLVLEDAGIIISADKIAEAGTRGRKDEPHEQKAIKNGIQKSKYLYENGKLDSDEMMRTFDRYTEQYLYFLEEGGDPEKFVPENGIFKEETQDEED